MTQPKKPRVPRRHTRRKLTFRRLRMRAPVRSFVDDIKEGSMFGKATIEVPEINRRVTYDYSCGGYLDYFIDKAQADFTGAIQPYYLWSVSPPTAISTPVIVPSFGIVPPVGGMGAPKRYLGDTDAGETYGRQIDGITTAPERYYVNKHFELDRLTFVRQLELTAASGNTFDFNDPFQNPILNDNDLRLLLATNVYGFVVAYIMKMGNVGLFETIYEAGRLLGVIDTSSLKYFNKTFFEKEIYRLIKLVWEDLTPDSAKQEKATRNDVEQTFSGGQSQPMEIDDEEEVSGKRRMKYIKQSAPREPSSKTLQLYKALCFKLEPHHDFHGARVSVKNKSVGPITSNKKGYYDSLMNVVKKFENRKPPIPFNIDNFTGLYYTEQDMFSSFDEFTNLLKIMKEIGADQKCYTISFKEKVDEEISSRLGESGFAKVASEEVTVSAVIDKLKELFGERRIYRDASGSVFLKRLSDLPKNKFGGPLRDSIEGSTDFAERLFDGAGASKLRDPDTILADYYGQIFRPTDIDFGKYINPENPGINSIAITPSIIKGTRIGRNEVVSFTINLPYKLSNGTWNFFPLVFDCAVYDLSLLIRYYMWVRDEDLKTGKGWKEQGKDQDIDTCKEECNKMIWVLLNVKRAGDHGQAERAKEADGIFESGDQLAACYGMMIDATTIVTYSRQGYGNNFILYGTELTYGQVLSMIKNYTDSMPDIKQGIDEILSNVPSQDPKLKVSEMEGDYRKTLMDMLTLSSSIVKINTVVKSVSMGKITLVKMIEGLKNAFDQVQRKLTSGTSMRETAIEVLRALPAKTILNMFSGDFLKSNKNRSEFETLFRSLNLLVFILEEIRNLVGAYASLQNTVVRLVKDYFTQLFRGLDLQKVVGLKNNMEYVLDNLKKGRTGLFSSIMNDINNYVEDTITDLLGPVKEFMTSLQSFQMSQQQNNE